MAFQDMRLIDTLFMDSLGNVYPSSDYPDSPILRTFSIAGMDTVQRQSPVPSPARPGTVPAYQEYITGLAHCNGKVEVTFNARSTNTRKFSGADPQYDYQAQTCSAVACHGRRNAYPWKPGPLQPLCCKAGAGG